MRLLQNTWLHSFILAGWLALFITSAYADDICSNDMELINDVESSLQKVVAKASGAGEFKVNITNDKDGAPDLYRITYEVNSKTIFKKQIKVLSSDDPAWLDETFDIKPVAQGKALYFNISSGAAGRVQCVHVFVPQADTVRKLRLDKQFPRTGIDDLDKDGDLEIIAFNSPDWIDTCEGLSMGGTPFWPSVFHVDISNAQLRNDSSKYPDFYANLAKDLKESYKSLARPSPDCTQGFQELISRAEKAGR